MIKFEFIHTLNKMVYQIDLKYNKYTLENINESEKRNTQEHNK